MKATHGLVFEYAATTNQAILSLDRLIKKL